MSQAGRLILPIKKFLGNGGGNERKAERREQTNSPEMRRAQAAIEQLPSRRRLVRNATLAGRHRRTVKHAGCFTRED